MGLFSGVAKAVSSVARPVASALTLGLIPAENKIDVASPPELDPNVKKMSDQTFNLYNQFKQNRPGLEKGLINDAVEQNKMDLAQKKQDIAANANARGLLYSGLRENAQLQAGQQAASKTGADIADIQNNLENQQMALEEKAFNQGVQSADAAQTRYNNLYTAQLKAKEANRSGLGGLLGTFGGISGGILGSKNGSA